MNLQKQKSFHPGTAALAALLVVTLHLSACSQQSQPGELIRLTGDTMGTTYTVKVKTLPSGMDLSTLQAGVAGILERINGRMSTYKKDSELSSFNNRATTEWVGVSAETALVVHEALRISRLTGGAFDITVGPLVNLWGFGPSRRKDAPPSDNTIQKTLASVGYAQIHVRESPPGIRKDQPHLEIDLSAIAKGYAVDQVAEYLESQTLSDYLVEIGGEIRAKGEKAAGTPWKVAIERPVPEERAVLRLLHLGGKAMATSGDYRNFFEQEGQLFSHTINPRTGKPVTHTLASVTVLSNSCMEADALATGLMVLGPEAGFSLAQREKFPALFVTRTAEGFEEKATPEFDQFLVS